MKKLLVAVLMAAMLCCSAVSVAFAASMPSVTKSNVTSKLSDEAVKVTDLAGNEVSLAAGPHGGSGAKSVFTDGTISSTATARLVDAEGNGVIGYVTLDAGAEYVVDSLLIDLCHDWGAADFIVQLSVTEDFSSPVTVFNNKAGEKFSADASRKTDDVVYNVPYQGLTFSFSPVRARYVRVTCDIVGNGKRQGYTTLGEIQLYAVEGSVVYTDALGQVADGRAKLYAAEEGAEIYYTTDGSAPTVRSALYKNGIALDGEITVRAISYKDGKYGVPCDFTFSGKAVFVSENAAFGKTAKAYLKDGTEATVTNHNGGQTLACVTDGVMGSFNSITLNSVGWIQVDLGASVWINRAVLNLWHNHVWRSITVQLSDDETFATGVQTIVCTDAGNWNGLSAYVGTLDPSWADRCNTEWIAGHTGENGFEFNFAPIKGRYIRALAQDGDSPWSVIFTELQAWTCEAPEFVIENAALGKTVKAYLKDGTEATVTNHNGGQTLACVTDGVMGAENSIQLDGQLGWIQVDLGASVWINRAVLNLWHDHVWRSITVQLSDDETFATGVQTIVCTDAGDWNGLSAYIGTLDPSWADRCKTEWIAGHTGANGFEFNFAPIKGRYIRAFAQDGSSAPYGSIYTELQAWTCEAPEFVIENAALGKTVKAYLKDGTEATVTNHNGGQTLACVTDGVVGAENSIQLDGQLGWIQVDLGASVWINRAVLNLWHDHVWRSITVQLSDDETFATGVQTIVCTDAGNWNGLSAYVGTLDPSWADRCNTEWIAGHTGANGFEFNFAPIKGRYIRAFAQDGSSAPYGSIYTELQAWTCNPEEAEEEEKFEYRHYVTSVSESDEIEVYEGKDFSDLGLSKIVTITYSDGTQSSVEAVWNCADYDKTQAGEYYAVLSNADEKDVYGLISQISVRITVKAIDMAGLQTLYDSVKETDLSVYTVTTATVFRSALADAEKVISAAYKTQGEIDGAQLKLNSANGALVARGDVSALREYVGGLAGETEDLYTLSSYAVYAGELAKANAVLSENGNEDMSQSDVDEVKSSLEAAVAALVARGNATELKACYDTMKEEKGYGEESTNGYTRRTWSVYMDAMYRAEELFDENAPAENGQSVFDDAKLAIENAVAGLEAIVETTALAGKAAEAEALAEEEYTAISYAALLEVMENVKKVLATDPALVEADRVDEAYAALEEALSALVRRGDKKVISEALGACAGEEGKDYTSASFAVYEKALYEANRAKNDANLTEEKAQSVAAGLVAAYEGLVKLADRESLAALVEQVRATEFTGVAKENADKAIAYAESMISFEGEVTEAQAEEAKALLEQVLASNSTMEGCSSSFGGDLSLLFGALVSLAAMLFILKKKGVSYEND